MSTIYWRSEGGTGMHELDEGHPLPVQTINTSTNSVTRQAFDNSADWVSKLVLEGKVYNAHVGAAYTPVSFAKTAYDADQPQFVIDVPAGTICVPLSIQYVVQDSAGTDTYIWGMHTTISPGAGTSTAVTPVNWRRDGNAAACNVYSLYTGNSTDPTTGTETYFWRDGYPFLDAATDPIKTFTWSYKDAGPPVVVGAGAIVLYIVATGTASAGFLMASWAEIPTSEYSLS